MAIEVFTPRYNGGYYTLEGVEATKRFEGRVLKVEQCVETRNWSDTLDYTDYRSTNVTRALVWLGTHGVPGMRNAQGRLFANLSEGEYWQEKARDLEFHEQFAWVDCTNIFADRGETKYTPTVDAMMGEGDPMMWANFVAWEAYEKSVADKAARDRAAREAEAAKLEEKRKAAAAKKAAKAELAKAEAEAQLTKCPKKGTKVTVDGFTGMVFWTGVSKYYGKWNARVGVKDTRGEVRWIDAAHWAK